MSCILVIDDDADIRRIVRLALERIGGYIVQEAVDGHEGLAIAQQNHPQLVLLDMVLPGISGKETLARLQHCEDTAAIPVVVMTARRDEQLSGVSAYIDKPFNPVELVTKVQQILAV